MREWLRSPTHLATAIGVIAWATIIGGIIIANNMAFNVFEPHNVHLNTQIARCGNAVFYTVTYSKFKPIGATIKRYLIGEDGLVLQLHPDLSGDNPVAENRTTRNFFIVPDQAYPQKYKLRTSWTHQVNAYQTQRDIMESDNWVEVVTHFTLQ